MFPRTKHSRTLWELWFWYLKSPFPGRGQVFQSDYISHDAAVPSGLMMFSGRWNCEVFAVQGSEWVQKILVFQSSEKLLHIFQTCVLSLQPKTCIFFSWMSFYQKSVFSVEKPTLHTNLLRFELQRWRGSRRSYTPRTGFSAGAYYEHLLGGSNADLKELKIKPNFCIVLCVLQTKSNIYFLLQPGLGIKCGRRHCFS